METEVRRILIIDDDIDYRKALLVRLNSLFPDVEIEEYDFSMQAHPPMDFDWEKYDVLILDYYLGENETGLDWFKKYKKSENFPATVVLTGMDSKQTAARVLKAGVHHYLSKKRLTKDKMYDGIEKALAVRASIVADFKKQSNHETDYDNFINNFLDKTEERLNTEILKDSSKTGHLPDKRLIDAIIERERQDILKLIDLPSVQEAKIGLLDIAAERIRTKSW